MTQRQVKDVAASVRDRIRLIHRRTGLDYNPLITRYYQERLLKRMELSAYADNFMLKGGFLLYVLAVEENWPIARPTQDIDFRAQNLANDAGKMRAVFTTICSIDLNDGIVFHVDEMRVRTITEHKDYPGVEIRIPASLGKSQDWMQIDIGFDDIVTPGPWEMELPVLLADMEPPRVKAYSVETVVAEKFEAMIYLSTESGRLKDYFDIHQCARVNRFDGALLQQAIRNTFRKRRTPFLPDPPIFQPEYFADPDRQRRHWSPLVRRVKGAPTEFADVVVVVGDFVLPIHDACVREEAFSGTWSPDALKWLPTTSRPGHERMPPGVVESHK